MLITPEYAALNRRMHEQPEYGVIGQSYAYLVDALMTQAKSQDVLDYGCGKRSLERALGKTFAAYDPALPGLDEPPEPHDIVVCTDVLEHIEPECLLAVLQDLRRCTMRFFFGVITCVPAGKNLPDGTNPHRICREPEWWLPRMSKHWEMLNFILLNNGKRFVYLGRPR